MRAQVWIDSDPSGSDATDTTGVSSRWLGGLSSTAATGANTVAAKLAAPASTVAGLAGAHCRGIAWQRLPAQSRAWQVLARGWWGGARQHGRRAGGCLLRGGNAPAPSSVRAGHTRTGGATAHPNGHCCLPWRRGGRVSLGGQQHPPCVRARVCGPRRRRTWPGARRRQPRRRRAERPLGRGAQGAHGARPRAAEPAGASGEAEPPLAGTCHSARRRATSFPLKQRRDGRRARPLPHVPTHASARWARSRLRSLAKHVTRA